MDGKSLLLRYEGAFPPQDWERLGGERIATGVWRFPYEDDDHLAQHLDARKAAGIAKGTAVFLNVLPQSLLQAHWRPRVVERMDELGIDHKDVVIEVVESEQAAPAELDAACDDLRRADVRIALDDIGAGFNGLSTLAAVRADFIKIDRGLVHQAQRSRIRTVLI